MEGSKFKSYYNTIYGEQRQRESANLSTGIQEYCELDSIFNFFKDGWKFCRGGG